MINVVRYNPTHQESWDIFVKTSKNGTFLFERAFMDYHKDRFLDHSIICFSGNKIIAILPANEEDRNIWSHQGLSYGGLVIGEDGNLMTVLESFNAIKKYYYSCGFDKLYYKSMPSFYCIKPSFEDEYALSLLGAKRIKVEINALLDLGSSFQFARNRKRMLEKANQNNLAIQENSDFNEFWEKVLIPNRWGKYQAMPTHKIEEIILLKSLFPNNIHQFSIYSGSKILAGGTIFSTSTTIQTQYIASGSEGLKTGAADFLVDFLIKKYSSHYKYLSFGTSTSSDGSTINKGVFRWKTGFGASAFPHYTYELDLR